MKNEVPAELLENLDLLLDYELVEAEEDFETIEELDHLGDSEEEP